MAKRKVGGKVKGAAKPKGVVKSQGLFSRLPKRAYKPTGVVHLKHEFADALDGEPDNTYWAIGGSQYETQRVAGSGADWASRINRSDRKDRGLLDYKNCKVTELKGFFGARGIKLPTGRRYKVDLIAALEKADDEATFTKFSDLPPELRLTIADKYFDALPVLPRLPHQPPLTLASPALRGEALPLFHPNTTLTLSFTTTYDYIRMLRTGPTLTTLHKDSVALLARIPAQSLGRIHKLRLQLYPVSNNPVYREHCVVKWDVDLSGSGAEPVIRDTTISPAYVDGRNEFMAAGRALEAALLAVRARPRANKLTVQDGDGFAAVLQEAFVALG
jgi:hypothetical protein